MSAALISLRDIAFQPHDRAIVHNINLEILSDEILTIVGPNGGGKSTLLRLILGLLHPTHGHITRHKKLRIGLVPQQWSVPADLPMSTERFLKDVSDNIDNPWLKRLNIDQLRDAPLQSLSGGETQRVLLARAILRQPDLLVLDEPASGIDPASLGEFYHLIRAWQQESHAGIVMVSHDLHLVMAGSDRVLCLNGHMCCAGKPEDIHEHPEFRHLLKQQHPDDIGIYTHQHNHTHL
ncbi:metal ABC transporter ATP-binding protein [Suttonella sp. R2A3]|uniref:ATP-binding cassette domain-containing protein n=1 Tax=Suttonella sp. R2A3 TaxID=2908648 RepID=UPI001F18C900|nr:metal ABC transporter ATP-binding protein [Suttonella sp. R2A3]UJF25260.1 metal ABC transporter ATP-binding protein [Suttonella sp. R2A3]